MTRLLLATLLLPATAFAQAPSSDVVSLSPAAREAALEEGATRALAAPPINGLSRGVHGEVGMEVSSNGGRAVYGSTVVPLGDTGSLSFSFLTGQSGRWRRP